MANASVILPIVLLSATSSNGFKSSNHFSKSAAISVPNPRSTSSAPNETNPAGILITPEATPAAAAVKKPVSSDFFFLDASTPP